MRTMLLLILAMAIYPKANSQSSKPRQDLWALTTDYLQAFEALDFDQMGTFRTIRWSSLTLTPGQQVSKR